MMTPADPHLLDAAAGWVARTRDPQFADWEAFTHWLEQDPEHNLAYECALDAHDLAGGISASPAAPIEGAPAPPRYRVPRWIGGAVAAGLVATIGVGVVSRGGSREMIETAAGEQRTVQLADGSVVALNGATRISYAANDPRRLRILSGEATFQVRHDPARPFVVEAGTTSVQDIGTVFNVVRGASFTDVAVAQGKVLYDPGGADVELTAGRTLHDGDSDAIQIGDVDVAAVGAWRHGRLIYRAAPIATVAADLSRATGRPVVADPAVAARTYTGTIVLAPRAPNLLQDDVAPLLGLRAVRAGDGWRLLGK